MDLDTVFEACARAAHEANRAYCLAQGDTSQLAWDLAPEWQQVSCLIGVRGVLTLGNGPAESHASWLAHKVAEGWKYGSIKDVEKKEHPCFLPYEELSPVQRAKDGIFVAVVLAVANALELYKSR